MKRAALGLFLLLLSAADAALAAPAVVCSASTGRVTFVGDSTKATGVIGNPQAIINPPAYASLFNVVPVMHWQCIGSAGAWTDVREMTAPEKAALAAEIAAAETPALHTDSCGSFSGQSASALSLRAEVDALVSEINVLRALYPLPVASITRSGTTATVTTRWAHGLTGTPQVTIHGATLAAYNGTFTIASPSGTTFTYQVAGSPVTPAVGTLLAFPATAAPGQRTLAQAKTQICSRINGGALDE